MKEPVLKLVILIQSIIILLLLSGLIVQCSTGARPPMQSAAGNEIRNFYFAATDGGRLVPIASLNEPIANEAGLAQFAGEVVERALSLSHNDYRSRLTDASRYFTRRGWASFSHYLAQSRLIDEIELNEASTTVTASAEPILIGEWHGRTVNGKMVREVLVPVVLSLMSDSKEPHERAVAFNLQISHGFGEDEPLAVDFWELHDGQPPPNN